jgi:hypothetical protein
MHLVNFRKNFVSFPSIFARISKFNIFAVTEHIRNQIFLERYPYFFFKMCPWVSIDGFLNGFSKFVFFIVEICILIWDFWLIFEKYSMRNCACWTYAETILSHTEHTRKRIHRTLSIRRTNFRVCSASGKMLSVAVQVRYAEHTGKWFYRTLSIRGNDLNAGWAYAFKCRISRRNRIRFSKISCYRTLGP